MCCVSFRTEELLVKKNRWIQFALSSKLLNKRYNSSFVVGIFLGLASGALYAQTLSNADLGKIIQSTINVAVSEPDTGLGVGVAIQFPDGSMSSYATGYRDIEKTTALGINDQFRIGSVSKTFTANAVLQQVNQGLFNIDDTVSAVAQKYGISIKLNNAENITVCQLLDMRLAVLKCCKQKSLILRLENKCRSVNQHCLVGLALWLAL